MEPRFIFRKANGGASGAMNNVGPMDRVVAATRPVAGLAVRGAPSLHREATDEILKPSLTVW